jgi:hypothetical protein
MGPLGVVQKHSLVNRRKRLFLVSKRTAKSVFLFQYPVQPPERQRFFPQYPEKPVTPYIYARILQFRPRNMEQFPRPEPRLNSPLGQNQLLYKPAVYLAPPPSLKRWDWRRLPIHLPQE